MPQGSKTHHNKQAPSLPIFDEVVEQKEGKSNWAQIRESLKHSLSEDEFKKWVKPVEVVQKGEKELELIAPNEIFYHQFLHQIWPMIDAIKTKLSLDVLVRVDLASSPVSQNHEEEAAWKAAKQKTTQRTAVSSRLMPPSPLNEKYTFDSFVGGGSNQMAYAAAQAVAKNPGMTYNPLFFCGGAGLGKTHLLHAIGNQILRSNPAAKITYLSAESFMNELIYGIRHGKMPEFRSKYRACDVLLLDDIQFISKKVQTQQEFFHTFNALRDNKKQIVMTSDLFPHEISDIDDRLRSRFQWGMTADIQPPDKEHRIAILYEKAAALGTRILPEVADFIAEGARRNVRELEGALHRINAFATLQGRQITLELAVDIFQDFLTEPVRKLSTEVIQKTVAEHFQLKIHDLKSKKRTKSISRPRQIAMYLIRQLTSASFPDIGEKFGGKDHSTVMHACSKIEKLIQADVDMKSEIETLRRKLEQLQ